MVFNAEERGLDVGLVCQGWKPDVGGVESHTADLARELRARGHRVHALALDYRPGREPYSVEQDRVEGVDVRRMSYLYHDHECLADVVDNWRTRDVLLGWLAETPCDVVHVHHLSGWGTGALTAIGEVGVPLVMTLHDYWPLCPRGQMVHTSGEVCTTLDAERCGDCLKRTWPHLMPSGGGDTRGPGKTWVETDADAAEGRTVYALECLQVPQRLLTPSAAARAVYAACGVAPERIEVCENGIAVADLKDRVRQLRESGTVTLGGETRLGVLGTVLPSKGVLELARAFLKASVPQLTLEIHGNLPSYHGDDSYVRELEALAERDTRIRIHGSFVHDDLARILAGLDGVAAPSRWVEVFGLTVREACAAGLPVLVSDAGDLPGVVGAGGARGLVVPAEDEAAWVEALQRFGGDPAAREAWAAAPREVRSAQQMALQVERVYVDVIREVTNVEPLLVHPVDAGEVQRERRARADEGGGLLRKLFGRS